MNLRRLFARLFAAALLLPLCLTGCSAFRQSGKVVTPGPRAFDFAHDTLALPVPQPAQQEEKEALADPALRGHVDAHVARQFFLHARFEPTQRPPGTETRIALVRQVLKREASEPSRDDQRVVIPGYANLREFSRLQGHLLRAESWLVCRCENRAALFTKAFGGDSGKAATVAELVSSITANRPALVRLYRHHALQYNRSLLVFSSQAGGSEVSFTAYDPAAPKQPVQLTFNRVSRAFALSDDTASSGPALGVELWQH
ncbi:MAG: hypothetical protein ABMA26_03750 [Limisphaerales bacterium]